MGLAALYSPNDTQVESTLTLVSNDEITRKKSTTLLFLSLTLIALQVMDGVLTGIGVYHFGLSREGNPLLHALMAQFGYINALIITKGLAIVIIGLVACVSAEIKWITPALKAIILLYLFAAVLPWSFILTTEVLFS